MFDKKDKAKLDEILVKRKRNLARLIYITYRHMHEWSTKKWKEDGWDDIKPDHLRLMSIVGADRVSNNELAKRARVSKQAMSKMVSLLEERGFVNVAPHPTDSRAKEVSLSKNGLDFFYYFNTCGKSLEKQFEDIIGKAKLETLIDIMSELAEGLVIKERSEVETK